MLNNSIVFTTIPVTDLDQAKEFYFNKLGLKQVPDPSKHGFMFEAGNGAKLFIYQKDSWAKDDHVIAAFFVDNMEEAVEELTKTGVVFEKEVPDVTLNDKGIAATAYEKAAWFKDPDGNMLALSQLLVIY
jgi:catechol 2,3-dioxygenase-like lactoylglutathione lyase family enzyme